MSAAVAIAWFDAESSKDPSGNYAPASQTNRPVSDPSKIKPRLNRHQLETAVEWLAGHETRLATIREADLHAIRQMVADGRNDPAIVRQALQHSVEDSSG